METIKEAKKKFVETGKLNRKIVRDEIALSWYKCQLNHMSTSKSKPMNPSASKISYLDEIIPSIYDYYVVDVHLNVHHKRTALFQTGDWESLSEHESGTNAAALAIKFKKKFIVNEDEHYLDCFSNVNTMAQPLWTDDELYGAVMLVSNKMFLGAEGEEIFSKISKKVLWPDAVDNVGNVNENISEMLYLNTESLEQIQHLVCELFQNGTPFLILGKTHTGKSTLAHEIFMKKKIIPYQFDCSQVPRALQESELRDHLGKQEALIIEHIECASEKIQNMLLSAIDSRNEINQIPNLIVTLTCRENLTEKEVLNVHLYNLFNRTSIYLPTYYEMSKVDQSFTIDRFLDAFSIKCSKMEHQNIVGFLKNYSTKEIYEMLTNLYLDSNLLTKNDLVHCIKSKFEKLVDCDLNYIKEIYRLTDENVSLTCDILNISRSTFYRKMEKDSK